MRGCMGLFGVRLRAISPVIAMIIIVAITLSIAFAVVGWLFGLWGGLAGGTPQISITNIKVYQTTQSGKTYAVVEFYVVNRGAGSDKILKVELIKGDKALSISQEESVTANERKWVTASTEINEFSLNVGDSVLVKVYFEKSGVYSLPAVVSLG